MFTVTREWIHKYKTPRGGWKRKQLALIDMKWPPTQGWICRVTGKQIPEGDRIAFESYAKGEQTDLVSLLLAEPPYQESENGRG